MENENGVQESTNQEEGVQASEQDNTGAGESRQETESQEQAEAGDTDTEQVVEKDGQPFIPKARFDQVYGKMKELEGFVQAVQSDPEVQRKLVESFKGEENGDGHEPAKETNDPSPTDLWIGRQSPEHQPFYRELMGAMGTEFTSFVTGHVQQAIDKALAPFRRYVADSETSRFYEKNPNAKSYEAKIVEVMRKHPTLSIQQAFALSSLGDSMAKKAGEKHAQERREKMNVSPINRGAGVSGQTKTPLPKGNALFKEAVSRALDKAGVR